MKKYTLTILTLLVFLCVDVLCQVKIEDVSPTFDNTTIDLNPNLQSVSGKGLCISASADGMRVYLGGHSGVWRSDDGGITWWHPEHPQPAPGMTVVPGALIVSNVYDLLVSPLSRDIILAATGRDSRVPNQSGVFRSTDGAQTWVRVHQFTRVQGSNILVGRVGRLAIAPDDPQRMYAAGRYAVGLSVDGGVTWSETIPQTATNEWVWHVVAGPQEGPIRRVYAVGTHVWYSQDGGTTWNQDPTALSLGFPGDGPGVSSRALAIHPSNPAVIYLINNGNLWRGDFSTFNNGGGATWDQLPSVPIGYEMTTASGGDYVVPHLAPDGQYYLIASDRRTVHISMGEPTTMSDWMRIDEGNAHVDPHGISITADFQLPPAGGPMLSSYGRIYMVNDGGANVSVDGAQTWIRGKGLSTLGLVNAAILPRPGGMPGICIGMGDNSGYFSSDGGTTWRTQDYIGGDNDCCFADPLQPSRLIVFAPRSGPKDKRRKIFLYVDPGGSMADGAFGTSHRQVIPGPPPLPGESKAAWNAVSNYFNLGYRPLILTPEGESPRPDGDFVTIRFLSDRAVLLRTTAMSEITDSEDWVTTATSESFGNKVFQQGPDLPDKIVNVVQASGGHDAPVFYVSDPDGQQRLWKWTAGMADWQLLVPGPITGLIPVPTIAQRFFVDSYRAKIVYVLDSDHIRRSDDGGMSWAVDESLENALTENGAFPFEIPYDGNPGQALLRDMIFDPKHSGYRFAVGPAGVFYTLDGLNWDHLLLSSAISMRPNNAVYDIISDIPDPCNRALYIATNNRGLLRLSFLPPEWPHPIGSIVAAEGKVTLLRVHDLGTKYGPPDDQLDVEVVIWLDSERDKAFGFQLRNDANEATHKGMLDLLRDAFSSGNRVRIDYVRTGCRTGRIIRVTDLS